MTFFKFNITTFITCIALLCGSSVLNAQEVEQFSNIEYITSNEGLSQSEVTAILQDQKGFLWIGTRGGLNRYDGSRIKHFQNEIGNPNSLINNSIETLFEDSNGHIWIGTKSNGVSRYIPEIDLFEQIIPNASDESTLVNHRITAISESSNNEIWLGSWNNGVTIYNPKTNSTRKELPEAKINDILKASDNKMWVLFNGGIHIYSRNGESSKFIDIFNNTSIIEDVNTRKFYIGTWSQGLIEYNPHTEERIPYPNLGTNSGIEDINNGYYLFQDDERNIWVGTYGKGVGLFNLESKTFTNYDLTSNSTLGGSELYKDVITVYQDNLGVLWFGTNGGGLCKVDKNSGQFGFSKILKTKASLPNEPIWSVLKDRENLLWIGIKGNNHLYYSKDSKTFSKLKLPKTQGNRKGGIKAIYEDNDGILWLGGNYNSIFNIQNSPEGIKLNTLNIENNEVRKITGFYQTKNGDFWIGTQQNGLKKTSKYEGLLNPTFESYLVDERISALFEDKFGSFWVGTYDGLHLYNASTNTFNHFYKKIDDLKSISSDIILCLYEDSSENLWIGTPNGLNLAEKNKDGTVSFRHYQVKDGLPNNYIHSILEDGNNNLWISTNKGITRFNSMDNSFYNYDVNDGLQSNSFMEGAGFKDKQGMFYFGGINGLNVFHPDSIKNNPSPSIVITGLKISGDVIRAGEIYTDRVILNKAIEYTNDITLSHNENTLSLEYSALDFSSSSNSYKIKLEGFDSDWQVSTSQTSVNYSNLQPAQYEFKVKSVNDSLIDDNNYTSLKITILPPFWKTWPAFIIYLVLFISLLLLYGYFINQRNKLQNKLEIARIERKKEEEIAKMKTQFFTDIAHEFRTPLSLIAGPVESLLGNNLKKEQQFSHLTTIQYHTKRLLHLVSQLLDFRKAESGKMMLQVAKGNFEKFTKEIFISFRELATSKNISYQLNISPSEIPLTYDRIKMEIVLCNLLSNAFKYTDSKIGVTVSLEKTNPSTKSDSENFPEGYCKIIVSDNGKGMPEEMVDKIFDRFYQLANSKSSNLIGTGIGLSLTKNIVELHKGEISVKSNLNEGSKFIVKLPLGETHFNKDQFIKDFKKAEDPIHYQVERVLAQKETISTGQNKSNIPTLLIVEDNSEIRAFLKLIFESDYRIIEAENGIIGLEKAKESIPEIIITDLMMPKMDGLTLCKAVRTDEDTLHIPIVMLTARTTNVFKEKGYNSGADIYVTKPFNPTLLKAQVEGLIKSREKLKEYFSNSINLINTEVKSNSIDQEFINKLMSLVEDNLTNEKLNRDFLASNMAVSSSTLYRKVKGLTGIDITVFIRSIRLKRAAQMILNKEDNISGIAYSVGFNDPKYFRKCFVKQFGVNPSQYRKNNITESGKLRQ